MKKSILFLFVTFLTLGLTTSCSSDDDKGSDGGGGFSSSIQGKWKPHQIGFVEAGQEFMEDYEHECATKHDQIEFLTSTWVSTYYDSDCIQEQEGGSYSISGNTLTITGSEEGVNYTETLEIIILDAHTLKLKMEDSYMDETYTFIQVYKRM